MTLHFLYLHDRGKPLARPEDPENGFPKNFAAIGDGVRHQGST